MYLQITRKCNFDCAHCCYACTMRGRHGKYDVIERAIEFAVKQDPYTISIGGGEPTLHPRFFDILEKCLSEFEYIWMASNGSQTNSMYRLARIIDDLDFETFFEEEDWCECETEEEKEYCSCMEYAPIISNPENKLSVEISRDHFHYEINQSIVDLWEARSKRGDDNFGFRDVSSSVAAQGRGLTTGSGWGEHCVCSDIMILPSGKLKLCGCNNSPIIGNVWNGITPKWEEIIYDEEFRNYGCFNGWRRAA